ncbi:MAG: VapC toxin family PIN domain ribonuclease [Solirubrobacterales bacterium]|nr:VapC toxin family PIN domain ribonuclease [Solirubrobacterales bacterium]
MTLDSSVLVSASDRDHALFEYAKPAALEGRSRNGRLIGHAIAETYSTITLPPFRRSPVNAIAYVRQFLQRSPTGIEPDAYPAAVEELAALGVHGPALYDGLIAIAARDANLTLLSLDLRALRTYTAVGVDFRFLQE